MTAGTTLIPPPPGQYGRRAALPDPPKPLDAMPAVTPYIQDIRDTRYLLPPPSRRAGRGQRLSLP